MSASNPHLVVVPEFILFETLESIFKFIRTDYAAAVTDGNEQKSFLYQLLRSTGFLRQKYYTMAKKVFLADIDDPRFLEVELIYNMQRMGPPTIYISHPGEQSGENGLSVDPNIGGYVQYNTEGGLYDPEDHTQVEGEYRETYTRRYNAGYQLMITSDNSNEVVMLYHILKALITTLQASGHLNLIGLENITLSGNDLQLRNDQGTTNKVYARALTVNIQYDTKTIEMGPEINPLGIIVGGILKDIELSNQFG
jgi:hypothetical protein